MTPFDAFNLYMAIKMHFTSPSYDAVKYNFKTSASVNSFYARKDRHQFVKLSKHKDPKNFIISNFIDGNSNWVGDLMSDEAQQVYFEWLKRQESLTYIFNTDMNQLDEKFVGYFKVVNGQHPELLKLVRQKKISIETLVILNECLNFFPLWDIKITDTIIWPTLRNKCLKYQNLLHYDRKKMKKIILERVKTDI